MTGKAGHKNDVICFSKSQVLDKQREVKVNKYLFSRHHHVSIPSWYNAEQSGSCSFQQTRFSRHDGLHSLLEVRRRLRSGMMYIRSSGGANDYQCDKHTTHWYGECSPNQQNNRMLNKNYSCHCGFLWIGWIHELTILWNVRERERF